MRGRHASLFGADLLSPFACTHSLVPEMVTLAVAKLYKDEEALSRSAKLVAAI